jgi:hypothetical protein
MSCFVCKGVMSIAKSVSTSPPLRRRHPGEQPVGWAPRAHAAIADARCCEDVRGQAPSEPVPLPRRHVPPLCEGGTGGIWPLLPVPYSPQPGGLWRMLPGGQGAAHPTRVFPVPYIPAAGYFCSFSCSFSCIIFFPCSIPPAWYVTSSFTGLPSRSTSRMLLSPTFFCLMA